MKEVRDISKDGVRSETRNVQWFLASSFHLQNLSWLPVSFFDLYGEVPAGCHKLLQSWFLECEVACAEYYHTSETHPDCKTEADSRQERGKKPISCTNMNCYSFYTCSVLVPNRKTKNIPSQTAFHKGQHQDTTSLLFCHKAASLTLLEPNTVEGKGGLNSNRGCLYISHPKYAFFME